MKKLKTASRPRLYLLITGLLLFAALGTAGVVYKVRRSDTGTQQRVVVCSDDLLKRASKLLKPTKAKDLAPLVSEISGLGGFERDPNCLYVVTTYYVNISDSEAARTHLDNLEKVFRDEDMSPVIYNANNLTFEELKETVRIIDEVSEQNRQQNIPSVEGEPGP